MCVQARLNCERPIQPNAKVLRELGERVRWRSSSGFVCSDEASLAMSTWSSNLFLMQAPEDRLCGGSESHSEGRFIVRH